LQQISFAVITALVVQQQPTSSSVTIDD